MDHTIPNCFYRISVKALIQDENGKFLLLKEPKGVWELPGGGLDFGENPIQGLTREIEEEMGLEVIKIENQPSYVIFALNHKNINICNVIYHVALKNLDFTPSDECVEIRFFSTQEAEKENLLNNVKEFIKVYKN